jgi:hypothetical protein
MNFDIIHLSNNIKDLEKLVENSIRLSEQNINKILSYDCINDKDKFLKVLEKDTIDINKIYSLLNLLSFINTSHEISNIENKLNEYNKKLKLNGNFIKKLIYFNKINLDLELYQKKFIENIIEQLKFNKIHHMNKIFIEGIQYSTFNVNIYNLNNVLINVSNKKDRIGIINKYNQNIYNILMDTIIGRFNESKYYMTDSYFLHKNKLSINGVQKLKTFMINLIKTVNSQLIKKKDLYTKKNFDYDDIIINETNFNFYNISLKYFISKTISFFSNYFNLEINKISIKDKWSDSVIVYEVKNKNIIGYLYLDLKKNNSNKPNVPIYINLNNSYVNKYYNFHECGQSCILASFVSSSKNIINYNMAQKLFVEFLLGFYNLFCHNNFGFSNINIENKNIIEILGEKIFQNENFIKYFYGDYIDDNLENYLEELRLSKLIKFRYMCIDSLYDMALHLDETIKTCNPKIIFEKTYLEISKCYAIENYNYYNLNPLLLYKINTDYGGKYYHNIFNEIICHNVSNLIVNKKLGFELFNTLTNINYDFMYNLKEFLKKYNFENKNMKFIIKTVNKENFTESEVNNYQEL